MTKTSACSSTQLNLSISSASINSCHTGANIWTKRHLKLFHRMIQTAQEHFVQYGSADARCRCTCGGQRDPPHNKVSVCWASQLAMRSLFRPSFGPPRKSTQRWSNLFHWCKIFKALGCSSSSAPTPVPRTPFAESPQLKQSSLQPHTMLPRGSVSRRSMIRPVCHSRWVVRIAERHQNADPCSLGQLGRQSQDDPRSSPRSRSHHGEVFVRSNRYATF